MKETHHWSFNFVGIESFCFCCKDTEFVFKIIQRKSQTNQDWEFKESKIIKSERFVCSATEQSSSITSLVELVYFIS